LSPIAAKLPMRSIASSGPAASNEPIWPRGTWMRKSVLSAADRPSTLTSPGAWASTIPSRRKSVAWTRGPRSSER
jgi:hypothetical protein